MSNSFTIKDIVMFCFGLTGGFAISYYFFWRQKRDSGVTHAELVSALDRNYEQALRNGVKHSSVIQSVRTIEDEVERLSDIVEIKGKMDAALSTLQSTRKGQEPLLEDILRYKTLGDRWSELVSAKLDLKIIDSRGEITFPRLLAVHKSIFPDDFPWAGKYRTQHVYVVDDFGTTARIVDVVQAESRTETIPPESIEENLTKLLNHWNGSVSSFMDREPGVKIDEVANFHHEFELIHPFLDGNGRIGRMLLEEQLSLLFKSQITFRPERDDYYMALRMMNMGQNDNFRDLVSKTLREFNVAL